MIIKKHPSWSDSRAAARVPGNSRIKAKEIKRGNYPVAITGSKVLGFAKPLGDGQFSFFGTEKATDFLKSRIAL